MTDRTTLPNDLVSLTEAAKLRKCSHQAISKLVKKERFTAYTISGHVFLSVQEVVHYKQAKTGRPKKIEQKKR